MKSKILITDECPDVSAVDEFYGAQRSAEARAQTVTKWLLGHACDVVQDNDPEWITMTVGERTFRDRRAEYPSVKLVADLCLAIYAGEGLSPSAFDIQDLDDMTVLEVLDRGTRALYDASALQYALMSGAYRGGKP